MDVDTNQKLSDDDTWSFCSAAVIILSRVWFCYENVATNSTFVSVVHFCYLDITVLLQRVRITRNADRCTS